MPGRVEILVKIIGGRMHMRDCARVTLVLYRTRARCKVQWWECRCARSIKPLEGSRSRLTRHLLRAGHADWGEVNCAKQRLVAEAQDGMSTQLRNRELPF